MVFQAQKRGLINIRIHDLRDFTTDRHKTVDDRPFGGGPGMVLRPEPVVESVEAVRGQENDAGHLVLLTPVGRLRTSVTVGTMAGLMVFYAWEQVPRLLAFLWA